MLASGTPCDESGTVSRSGQTVAAMRPRMSMSASSGTSTRNGRMALPVSCATAVMLCPLCARWPWFAVRAGLAEGEGVGLCAGVEEGDLERALGDRTPLADEVVQPRLGDRAVAVVVDVVPVVGARRLSVELHGEPRRVPACRRGHDQVYIPGGEAVGDPPAGFVQQHGARLHRPFPGEGPVVGGQS